MSKFFSAADVARALGYNREYVARLIKQGKIPGTKFGKKWLVAEEDFKELLDRLKKTTKRDVLR